MYFRQLRLPNRGCASSIVGGDGVCAVACWYWARRSSRRACFCCASLYATHACHFSEHSLRNFTMVQGKTGDDDIKALLIKRKVFCVSDLKTQVCEPARLTHLFCQC